MSSNSSGTCREVVSFPNCDVVIVILSQLGRFRSGSDECDDLGELNIMGAEINQPFKYNIHQPELAYLNLLELLTKDT